ncbi:MAG: acetyltransferase [Tunicatimonas sp.]|uniref:acetyltransferase n=1 Tax=Tunicatimonas sp. TaxID=1940096 RepID=UPI003C7821B3
MNTNPIIIFGASGFGKAALEIFQSNQVVVYGFLDDDEKLHNTEINEVTVLGNTEDHGFLKLIGKKCDAFVAETEQSVRKKYFKMLNEKRKVMPANAIHSQAVISSNAHFSYGIFANAGVTVGSFAKVGQGCILQSNSVVDYEATLGEYVHLGAGSVVHSGATVEDNVFIGAGVTIAGPLTVGKGARIGAGSVVVEPVKAGATVFGNPAKPI